MNSFFFTNLLGWILAAGGGALSLGAFVHDVRRQKTGREHGGQAAPKRIAPEVHAVAALVLGFGAGLIAGWRTGCAGGCIHAVIAYGFIHPWINR